MVMDVIRKKEKGLGQDYTNPHIIETTCFVSRIGVDGPLNHCGERFKKDAVLVSGFTFFMWTEG